MALPNQPFTTTTFRDIRGTEFVHADGTSVAHDVVTQTTGILPNDATDVHVVERRIEYGCGCFFPDVPPGGACADCNKEGRCREICYRHYVVCPCGMPCCWKHSVEEKETGRSLCKPCHLKKERKARWAAFRAALVHVLSLIFLKK